MTRPALAAALGERPVLLDGGLATELEAQGHDLSGALWSARLLADAPEAIAAAHLAFFRAGAEVATTASYQASLTGFAAAGVATADAERLITRSVRLARDAAGQVEDEQVEGGKPRWVVGSVGPYGAALADGSEYRGDYGLSVADLRAWHRPRLQLLAAAGVDVLALETIPCLAEVEALLAEVSGLGVPCWLSLTSPGGRTRFGEPVEEAYAMAAGVTEVIAVGANCLAPGEAGGLIGRAAETSGRPAVCYPNRGEEWDGAGRRWVGVGGFEPAAVEQWVADGARLVGGCCRVRPADIAEMRTRLDGIGPLSAPAGAGARPGPARSGRRG